MKKIFIWGAFALLTTTLFSCTADDYEDAKTNSKPLPSAIVDGPGDLPIIVPPPPPKNPN